MIREAVTASPLSWPEGWPRTPDGERRRSAFARTTLFHEIQGVLDELRRMGVKPAEVVVSTNLRVKPDGIPYAKQPATRDPGAAVWFTLDGAERVLACDRWDWVEHNVRAIRLHVGSIRAQERWGVGSAAQAFAGFVALPASTGGVAWWDYFGLDRLTATEADVAFAYRESAKFDHPDAGGERERWDELQAMRRAALAAVKGRASR